MTSTTIAVRSRFWLPGAVLGGATLTVLAVLVPLPSFEPAPPSLDPGGEVRKAPFELPGPVDAGTWSPIAASLETLRPPPPEPVKPIEVEVEEPPETQQAPVQQPTRPRLPPLGWQYKGRIQDDPAYALIIKSDGRQSFIREGDVVEDPSAPGQRTLTIVAVTPMRLVIDRDGVSETIRLDPTPTTAPVSGLNPRPGANPERNPGAMNRGGQGAGASGGPNRPSNSEQDQRR